jgi:hypothetical protein
MTDGDTGEQPGPPQQPPQYGPPPAPYGQQPQYGPPPNPYGQPPQYAQPAYGYGPGPAAHRQTAPGARVGVVGLAIAALGAVLIIIGFTATKWLSLEGLPGLKFSDIHDATNGDTSGASGLAVAYFGWLAWVLFAVVAIGAIIANLPTSVSGAFRVIGALVAAGAAILTFFAIKLDSQGGSYREYLKHSGPGYWLAVAGFLIMAAGAAAGPANPRQA